MAENFNYYYITEIYATCAEAMAPCEIFNSEYSM